MSKAAQRTETEISITTAHGTPIEVRGDLDDLHADPEKVQKLLDLLGVPKGTEVRITRRASSVIVR